MSETNNTERPVAIKITGVKKKYKLGQIGGGTLREDIQSWWARKHGREDPNAKIGTDQRSYGKTFMALNGVDLTIYQGEAVGIIGSNGAGKSTLLKLLSRVTAPTEGEIDIHGRIASMLEVGTGFNGEMTGRENIYMNGAILGMTKAEIDAKIEDIIEFSEVREFIDTPVKRYSSGMFVKLAFSVAAHLDAEIMIMDEVLAVGDMAFQKKCLTKMREAANQDGRTVLYVSHNMNTIRQLCDRCIVLDKGKVVFEGDVEEAIGVYSNRNIENKLNYSFEKIPRSKNEKRTVQILGIDICDKSSNIFVQGELVHLLMHCFAKENVGNNEYGIRFEIHYEDGSEIGTAFGEKCIEATKNEAFDLEMTFSTDNIPAGKYYVVALAFEYDIVGNQIGIDRIEPAMFFEISPRPNDIVWSHQWWGHIRLDDMAMKKIITNKSISERDLEIVYKDRI